MSIVAQLLHHAEAFIAEVSQPTQMLGLASATIAAALIIVSSFVKTMIPLRWLAVGSNVGFVVYGILHPSPLMFAMNAALLPINLWRVREMIQLTRRVANISIDGSQLEVWLRPYTAAMKLKAGTTIFRRGDTADRMYFLVTGRIDLPEVGGHLDAGQMFGEIAFFAPDRRRSSSAVCATDCTLLSIDDDTFKQLVYQNPEFGFEVVTMIAGRLTNDVRRAQTSPRAPADAPRSS